MKNNLSASVILCLFISFFSSFTQAQTPEIRAFKLILKDISKKYPVNPDSVILLYNQKINTPDIQKDDIKKGYIQIAIGKEYATKKKDIPRAMQYFEDVLALAKKKNDCTLQIEAIINLALGYYQFKQIDKQIQTYEKAAALCATCPECSRGAYIYTQLALNCMYKTDLDRATKAEPYFLKADSVINSRNDIQIEEMIFNYFAMVRMYHETKNRPKTLLYAEKVRALNLRKSRESGEPDLIANVMIADMFKEIGELDSAIIYTQKLVDLPLDNLSETEKEKVYYAYQTLGNIYVEKGDLKKAIEYKDLHASSLIDLAQSRKSDDALGKIKILEDELILAKKQKEINANRFIIALISVLALLVLSTLFFVYNNGKKLKLLNTQLEAQKQVLTEQKQELTTLNEIRTKMFSVLSHDLISPIGALKNMFDLYHKDIITKAEFDTHSFNLKDNLSAMLKTINNILDWSFAQLNGKKPFIEPLNIYNIVSEQFELQSEVARQKNIELTNLIQQDFTIKADNNHLNLIARNLINNALKFTPEGGKIVVKAFNTEGGKVLEFRDSGKGMSAEKLEKLFSFNDKDKRHKTTENQGVGLGMRMVNDLVAANKCKIMVESKENEGTVFKLLFTDN
jgi:signal transduction histidine kinase